MRRSDLTVNPTGVFLSPQGYQCFAVLVYVLAAPFIGSTSLFTSSLFLTRLEANGNFADMSDRESFWDISSVLLDSARAPDDSFMLGLFPSFSLEYLSTSKIYAYLFSFLRLWNTVSRNDACLNYISLFCFHKCIRHKPFRVPRNKPSWEWSSGFEFLVCLCLCK